LTALSAELVDLGDQGEEVAARTQDNWPHAFARFHCNREDFIENFHCNHIHGVYGDVLPELETVCWTLGIEFRLLK
jgi:L-fucose isomerase